MHPTRFRLLESGTNATIDTLLPFSTVFDATFGDRVNPNDPIEESRDLEPGFLTVQPPLLTNIRNDIIP